MLLLPLRPPGLGDRGGEAVVRRIPGERVLAWASSTLILGILLGFWGTASRICLCGSGGARKVREGTLKER